MAITAVIIFPLGGDSIIEPPALLMEAHAAERVFGAANAAGGGREITPLSITEALADATPRHGYILAPTMFSEAGVDTLSRFILRTPTHYTAHPPITIDGNPTPTVTREDNNTFTVTPAVALTPNSVYVFRLSRGNLPDITWAFQTAKRFEISGTLPRNQATNVPVRTGIEITFSFGAPDISENFRIYPHVEGRFTYRGSTAIFMPTNPLEYGTVYTVTIGAGVTLPGTSEATAQERVFSFETAIAPGTTTRENWNATLHFSTRYTEFPTFAEPHISYWLNYDRRTGRPAIEFNVYALDDQARAIAAVNRLAGAHHWSRFSDERFIVDTANLTRISSTTVHEPNQDEHRWNEIFVFPDALPAGFYVLNAITDGETSQAIIQITDLAAQVIADETRALVWVNEMQTGRAAAARIYDPVSGETFETTSYGIAVVERKLSTGEYLIINAGEKTGVIFVHSRAFQHFWHNDHWNGGWDDWEMPVARSRGGHWWATTANNQYWTALQLDRTLFQRADTLNLWGFVQNRRAHENITHVTAVLTEHSWWRWDADGLDTLHMQNIPVAYGAFSGEIRLPHLDPGSYEIAIYHGDILLNSIFFTVMDYVKPPYQLTVSASHAAIFAGEEVTFTARTEFFEGTPVPDLSITYSFHGWELRTPASRRVNTNADGIVETSAAPTATGANVQGQRTMNFTAEATLPEIGWVHERANVRVFINDINVRPRASRDGAAAVLSVDVHNITLDRLNDGTSAHWGDFLCEPRAGQNISAEIFEIYWERVRDGEFYCHVTREVVPRYRHVRRENSLERFQITTGADGVATHEFTVPDRYRRSYEARLSTTDGNGRTIRHTVFIGRNWDRFFESANDDRLFLYGAEADGYDIGDEVELTIMRGSEAVTQGNFLFVVVADGILSYHIGANPLQFIFGEAHVPNAQVFAYHFNGHTFNTGGQMAQRLRFNPANRELVIEISTCRDEYRPGETPTFTIRTTDLAGNPKAANVNISLVDEALFSLMDYTVDTLAMLYANIDDNLQFSFATHRTFVSDGIELEEGEWGLRRQTAEFDMAGVADAEDVAMEPALAAPGAAPAAGAGGDDTRIRERFEDTAMFASVRTNANGEATLTFPLPDNITSWRVTASAISTDLYAGNTVQNVRVTLPMFVHYTLNNIFLVGDIPTIGVNAFGTSLSGGERVEFSVWLEDSPAEIRRATGAAFERVNIPLWEMSEEGFGAIVIRAEVAGFSDAVRHEYQVLNSHRQIDTAIFYEVTPQTVFATNATGLTNITFTDHGRGQFLHDLLGLRHTWWSGARVEAHVARCEANALISAHFPDVRIFGTAGSFDILDYQTQSGGMAVLPHADAELAVTVKLMPFILGEINQPALRGYLRNIFENSATDNKMLALYGLAMLGEPVLFELRDYALLPDLSVRNAAYVALGFAALGDTVTALDIFDTRISTHIQRVAPYYRVNAANRAEILDATSVTALLAAKLNQPQALGLHNYATNARFEAIMTHGGRRPSSAQMDAFMLLNLERLAFISAEIENHTDAEASITYTLFGETRTRNLGHGGQFTLRIPAQNMHEFNLISTTGEVGAVSIIRTPLEDIDPVETDITVRREFFRAGTNVRATTFEQDEIIRVQITVDYSARDLAGTYVITDFLPAGLVLVQDSARFGARGTAPGWRAWATTEGQRVTFHDHNGRFDRAHTYFYYARVVNPGTFRAEGTVVQSFGVREYLVVGEDAVITIN